MNEPFFFLWCARRTCGPKIDREKWCPPCKEAAAASKHETVAVFIDGGFVNKVLDFDFNRAKLHFEKLAHYVARGRSIYKTYYYYCPSYLPAQPSQRDRDAREKQNRFFEHLKRMEFEVRLGRLLYRGRDSQGQPIVEQKQVDILLALDWAHVAERHKATNMVLVTSDSDFTPLVQYARTLGICVELYASPVTSSMCQTSSEFKAVCNKVHAIDDGLVSVCRMD